MKNIKISVANDFSITPGGRYIKEGKYSGEEFRIKFLEPEFLQCLNNGGKIIVDLDGCLGYPSSFLDESFGGLARKYPKCKVVDYFEFVSEDQPNLPEVIKNVMLANEKL